MGRWIESGDCGEVELIEDSKLSTQERSYNFRNFSIRECAIWFFVPAALGIFLIFFATIGTNAFDWNNYQNFVLFSFFGFLFYGILSGLCSAALYIFTFWMPNSRRPVLIITALAYLLIGNAMACIVTENEADRERLKPLTKEETYERNKKYNDVLFLTGSIGAVISGGTAFAILCLKEAIKKRQPLCGSEESM